MSPDMVSEVKVLTSNYAPEYGSSTVGPDHGGHEVRWQLVPWLRHSSSTETTRCWPSSGALATRPRSRRKTTASTSAVPSRSPGCGATAGRATSTSTTRATGRQGGSNQPTLSIPSLAERNGDFRDWRDAAGNLIPIYDPATLDSRRPVLKQQFMGCDGHTPNVICPDRISATRQAVARRPAEPDERRAARTTTWRRQSRTRFWATPTTTWAGSTCSSRTTTSSRASGTSGRPPKFVSTLPQSIANETYSDPQNSWVNRFNWDRTVSGDDAEPHVDGVPEPQRRLRLRQPGLRRTTSRKIAGVAGYNVPPQMTFGDGFATSAAQTRASTSATSRRGPRSSSTTW